MKYLINSSAIIDVTKPPYCADNTGKQDCTQILCRILDDILIRQVTALQATHDKLVVLSDHKTEDAYIGLESGKVEDGNLSITFPEYEPSAKIIYFPRGTYLVSDTITYSLENLKQLWYGGGSLSYYENCRNIHLLGESKEETVIRLANHSKGFEAGNQKPLISFVNNEKQLPRNQEFTNVAFMNTIEDITLDCGIGNPGVIGIKYVSSNCGRIENIAIKTSQGQCGIFIANNTTQAVISDICISGFDYGIDVENSAMLVVEQVDLSQNILSGIYTDSSTMICRSIISGNIPDILFKGADPSSGCGRYYFADPATSIAGEISKNQIYRTGKCRKKIPVAERSGNPEDWICVDDFGAVGDGITDCTRSIQKAMNSGKPIVVFGEGEYLIDGKIKIPSTVKVVDFLFCSLACGSRLIGGEYDSAFEISENSDDFLFMENLSTWERFKGHIRFVKHAAKRDAVFSDIHLMTMSMYFNSVPGSTVYFDNCFLTTGTYTRTAMIPGKGFVPVYSHIIPYEFHGQTVYGRVVNPERADIAMFNDGSEIIIDGYRTEGSGTALKSIHGGKTSIHLFNAGIGCKEAENPVFDLQDSSLDMIGCLVFGFSEKSEYNIIIQEDKSRVTKLVPWDSVTEENGPHSKRIDYFKS